MNNVNILSPQMKVNVEAILNGSTAKEAYSENGISSNILITNRPKSNCYYMEVTFHNEMKNGDQYTDPETGKKSTYFTRQPRRINAFRIEQLFDENFLNHYEINVVLDIKDYQLLFYNYKDLRCDLTLYSADASTNQIYGKTVEGEPVLQIMNAYCLFKDKQDIFKKIPRAALIPDNEADKNLTHQDQPLDVAFQIVPNEDYMLRLQEINTILRNSTVKDAIWAIAASTHCTDAIMLVDPDNKTVYKNLIIPPMLSTSEALKFLQRHYGIYNKGLNYYYQLGTLYVYPQFETSPVLPKDKSPDYKEAYTQNRFATVSGNVTLDEMGDGGMTHVYMVGNQNYVGLQCYHAFEGKTIHIISNGESSFRDLTDEGLENIGYSFAVHHTSRDIDLLRAVLEADSGDGARYGIWPIDIHQTPNNSYLGIEGQNTEIGITSTKSQISYVEDKSNIFTVQSLLNSYKRTIAGFTWNNAVPFTFRPGYRICFHYDGEDESARDLSATVGDGIKYTTRDGVVDSATYTFNLTKTGATELYTCQAEVFASLTMEKTNHLEGYSDIANSVPTISKNKVR